MGNTRSKNVYVCSACGAQTPKWQGQCLACNAWNTLLESVVESEVSNKRFKQLAGVNGGSRLRKLAQIKSTESDRLATGISEFDRALGGGLVAGGVVLIGGDPGIGKSTLLLQALARLSNLASAIYVSGEESAEQVALRAKRLELPTNDLSLLTETQLEKIIATLEAERPSIVVVDSIQTMWSDLLNSAPGSVAQVRECAAQLTRIAKALATSVLLVGHVTKEGAIAGPRVLEHIVDTVLYFEGDTHSSFRLLRASKNRFGAVNELGVFAMTDKGLKGVNNPSALFLSQYDQNAPGSAVLVAQEGTRPLLVEIQALVDNAHGNPRRLTVGLESQRLAMLIAVLHRHVGLLCVDQDVFVNAVGGVKLSEPAADLAVMLAMVSSLTGHPLPGGLVLFGEVGLSGEIRPAPKGQERLKEAAKLGFKRALIPQANRPKRPIAGLEVVTVQRIYEAVAYIRERGE